MFGAKSKKNVVVTNDFRAETPDTFGEFTIPSGTKGVLKVYSGGKKRVTLKGSFGSQTFPYEQVANNIEVE